MNVDSLVSNVQTVLGRLGQQLIVQNDGHFGDSLTLGQILKGKVLMHYEGTRYGVSFGGEEKVVDSAVPLKTGDVIYGRVVGLGDKVHLQRRDAPAQTGNANPDQAPIWNQDNLSARERLVAQLFERYQSSLTAKEQAMLMRLVERAAKPELMALSALVLNKLGLTLTAEAVFGVLRVLEKEQPASLRRIVDPPRLAIENSSSAEHSGHQVGMLAGALEEMLDLRDEGHYPDEQERSLDSPTEGMENRQSDTGAGSGDEGEPNDPNYLGTWLLNGQGERSVAHRISTFPLWFGDRLIEVSVALFNQREQAGESELRHRRIVLALDTEHLGHIEIVAGLAGQNARLDIRTQDDEATEMLAGHLQTLRRQLEEMGWNVDSINYATLLNEEHGEVVRSVVEHFVTQDSVNQLV